MHGCVRNRCLALNRGSLKCIRVIVRDTFDPPNLRLLRCGGFGDSLVHTAFGEHLTRQPHCGGGLSFSSFALALLEIEAETRRILEQSDGLRHVMCDYLAVLDAPSLAGIWLVQILAHRGHQLFGV